MEKLAVEAMGRLSVDEFKQAEKSSLIVMLDNVRSMHNVGSVFRTADCFAVESLYLCGITACPPHREIEKTALGATRSVEWKYIDSAVTALLKFKELGYQIYAVEQTKQSVNLQKFKPSVTEKYVLIFGNEVNGVSDDVLKIADGSLEIPQFGTKHSFNISISVGIVLWDFFTKLN